MCNTFGGPMQMLCVLVTGTKVHTVSTFASLQAEKEIDLSFQHQTSGLRKVDFHGCCRGNNYFGLIFNWLALGLWNAPLLVSHLSLPFLQAPLQGVSLVATGLWKEEFISSGDSCVSSPIGLGWVIWVNCKGCVLEMKKWNLQKVESNQKGSPCSAPGVKLPEMKNLLRHFTGAASVPWLLQSGTSWFCHFRKTKRETTREKLHRPLKK